MYSCARLGVSCIVAVQFVIISWREIKRDPSHCYASDVMLQILEKKLYSAVLGCCSMNVLGFDNLSCRVL